MTYQAAVFNVMIASPSDVASERAQVRAVIDEWNAIHSFTRKIVLLPLGWETHASPQMGAFPQTIINEQVLAKADIVIGIFWTRIGTQTEEYDSGTVEEIERHIDAGKLAMLYFSNSPVEPDSVEPEQYRKLKEFRQSCKDRGLYEPYNGVSEFHKALNRHLQLKLNEHPMFITVQDPIKEPQDIIETKNNIPQLSDEARILLKQGSIDRHGVIMHMKYLSGVRLQVNGKNYITSNEQRVIALWEGALEMLINMGLIKDSGHKGEVYQLTSEGYRVADMLPA